jgi:uncharacterized protein (TIGR02145 family)
MKTLFYFAVSIAFALMTVQPVCAQGAAINATGNSPDPSAALDVNFTDKGFLPPRMTTVQRNSISNPAAGLMIFNTSSGCINIFNGSNWREDCPTIINGIITTINCVGATNNGTLDSGQIASGVSSVISYTGGNGEPHNGQTVTSTGVTGLTATLTAGTFASGSGTLTYTITGTPSSGGTASFAINIGGQTCTLQRSVTSPPVWTCGTAIPKNHAQGTVAPESKSVIYGTTTMSATGSKCWITRNLGAANQASSFTDNSEASAGWYWQYNRMQGYKHDGSSRTPNNAWNNNSESTAWTNNNDPCTIELGTGWRLPTNAEWISIMTGSGFANGIDAYNSALKLHAGGDLNGITGNLEYRTGSSPSLGQWWSKTQESGIYMYYSYSVFNNTTNPIGTGQNHANIGYSVRCIKD